MPVSNISTDHIFKSRQINIIQGYNLPISANVTSNKPVTLHHQSPNHRNLIYTTTFKSICLISCTEKKKKTSIQIIHIGGKLSVTSVSFQTLKNKGTTAQLMSC